MTIQVLVSTMNQVDYTLLDKLHLQSDAVVINQCGRVGRFLLDYKDYKVLWIDSDQKGLSRSRNQALANASADVCVLCDDDEVLKPDYPSIILDAYHELPDADFIAFNINRIDWNEHEKIFKRSKLIPYFKTYSSSHLTFKLYPVRKNEISFDERFGAGSDMYLCAEDGKFCMACHRSGLRMYTHKGIISDVACEQSTWFHGYNEEFFFYAGAYVVSTFPKLSRFLKWYYPFRCREITNLGIRSVIKWINSGMHAYKQGLNYMEYMGSKNTDDDRVNK